MACCITSVANTGNTALSHSPTFVAICGSETVRTSDRRRSGIEVYTLRVQMRTPGREPEILGACVALLWGRPEANAALSNKNRPVQLCALDGMLLSGGRMSPVWRYHSMIRPDSRAFCVLMKTRPIEQSNPLRAVTFGYGVDPERQCYLGSQELNVMALRNIGGGLRFERKSLGVSRLRTSRNSRDVTKRCDVDIKYVAMSTLFHSCMLSRWMELPEPYLTQVVFVSSFIIMKLIPDEHRVLYAAICDTHDSTIPSSNPTRKPNHILQIPHPAQICHQTIESQSETSM